MSEFQDQNHQIAIFKGKQIRRTLFEKEWWFSVVDVIEALTDSNKPSVYWSAMKARVKNEDGFQLSTICKQLKLEASDGKNNWKMNLGNQLFILTHLSIKSLV